MTLIPLQGIRSYFNKQRLHGRLHFLPIQKNFSRKSAFSVAGQASFPKEQTLLCLHFGIYSTYSCFFIAEEMTRASYYVTVLYNNLWTRPGKCRDLYKQSRNSYRFSLLAAFFARICIFLFYFTEAETDPKNAKNRRKDFGGPACKKVHIRKAAEKTFRRPVSAASDASGFISAFGWDRDRWAGCSAAPRDNGREYRNWDTCGKTDT